MHMRIWAVLGTCWVVILVLGAHGFAAARTLELQNEQARLAARQVADAELVRLRALGGGALRADSTDRPRLVYGIPLRVVVVTGPPRGQMVQVDVRVLDEERAPIYAHRTLLPVRLAAAEASR